ncbi:MAG: capreomycidine synthase [Pirellulaceae bacterium]
MLFPDARLEAWMREAYFQSRFDIGSSGVENFQLGELCDLIGYDLSELSHLRICDSQTLGDGQLRQAIADRYADGNADRVMVTNGSTEANFLLHCAIVQPCDEIIVLEPVYQQLASLAQGLGAKNRIWRLHEEHRFAPNIEDLKYLLSSRTKAVILNFPHNPTGVTISTEQLEQLISAIASVNAWLIWDAAFAEIQFEGTPLPDPILQYDRAISMGTLSKAFGLPGLRVGWCIAPETILERCTSVRDYVSLHLSPLVEAIALQVIRNAASVIANRMERVKANLGFCSAWANEHRDYLTWTSPQAGVCAFPRFHDRIDVDQLCKYLVREESVLLVPGSCFGFPRHARFGFGGNRSDLEEATMRLSRTLRSNQFIERDRS